MTEQPSPAQAPPHAAAAEATAAPPAEQLKTEQLAAVPAIAGAAPSGAGAKAQAVPAAEPPAIPVCSGLPPHALLMLGNAGAELFQVPVAERQKQPKPFRADASVAQKSHIPTASFAFDVWRLAPQAEQVLSLLVQQLQDSELDFSIRIEGHTDSLGSETYNYNLSLLRAKAVAAFLTDEKGLAPDRVATAGCGEWKPLASNQTDEGRTLNRRFELVILPAGAAR
jgi:outer membrane protein OmpA-like peptidoglycan-associated protein